jgi:2-pyrone-4,6-dicarboxylate lactonase
MNGMNAATDTAGQTPGNVRAGALFPGAVDCHAHVFGPASRFAYAPERKYTPPDAPAQAHLSMLDGIGMTRGVLVQGSAHGLDNTAMLDALAMAPERLRGIAVMPGDTPVESLRALCRRNVVGLRFFSDTDKRYGGSVSLAAACSLIPALQRSGMQVQLLAPLAEINDTSLRRLAAAQIPVVIDHFGHVDTSAGTEHWLFARLCDWLASGLVWVKLSAVYRMRGDDADDTALQPFHQALVAANTNGLLWGSDWPHPNFSGPMPDVAGLLGRFLEWTPDPAVRQRILASNPASLFGF